MSIDSYSKRTTKVINNESTPECSPHPSESLGSTTIIPTMQVTPPKSSKQGAGAARQLPPIPVTNPSARVGRCGGEGGEGEQRTKGSRSTKKRTPYVRDGAHASLDPDEALPAWPMADGDDDSVFADSSQAPHGKAESEREEEAVAVNLKLVKILEALWTHWATLRFVTLMCSIFSKNAYVCEQHQLKQELYSTLCLMYSFM